MIKSRPLLKRSHFLAPAAGRLRKARAWRRCFLAPEPLEQDQIGLRAPEVGRLMSDSSPDLARVRKPPCITANTAAVLYGEDTLLVSRVTACFAVLESQVQPLRVRNRGCRALDALPSVAEPTTKLHHRFCFRRTNRGSLCLGLMLRGRESASSKIVG